MTARASYPSPQVLELYNGEVMTSEEFQIAYEARPDDAKFELIEGVVHMASPAKLVHSNGDRFLNGLTWIYEGRTPGTHGGNSATVKFSPNTDLQPDGFLRILSEYGGQTTETEEGYLRGAPEFVIEVSNTSRSIDLNAKRLAYARHGVLEYLVLNLQEMRFHWFDLQTNLEIAIDPDEICRVRKFPGLWLDCQAIVDYDIRRAEATLFAGLASSEHAAFVEELSRRRITPPAS
ncbi:Uma2 family endonuclease [Zavarzinella formosa]|uniref:Uma2 family endonuclease n=1 Tax=Zavarzinella formosa TaxID=360055 RepID=UPI0002FB2F20|nr:Uma2 family endonuclease [Zavarzinella formosa]